jgi:hypothetical protein
MAECLVILILAPAIIVIGFEGRGYRPNINLSD